MARLPTHRNRGVTRFDAVRCRRPDGRLRCNRRATTPLCRVTFAASHAGTTAPTTTTTTPSTTAAAIFSVPPSTTSPRPRHFSVFRSTDLPDADYAPLSSFFDNFQRHATRYCRRSSLRVHDSRPNASTTTANDATTTLWQLPRLEFNVQHHGRRRWLAPPQWTTFAACTARALSAAATPAATCTTVRCLGRPRVDVSR